MEKEIPLITVVTTTYNKFEHIFETISSIFRQDYSKIEYIIADDGSKEFPYSEIVKFIEKNKKDNILSYSIIINEKNLGTVKNVNNAYKKAKGKYIVPLSQDDSFVSESTISEIVCEMEKRACNILVTSRLMVDEKDEAKCYLPHVKARKIIESWRTNKDEYMHFVVGMHYSMASGSAMYINSDYLKENDFFDEKYVLWEDGPFIEKTLRTEKIESAYNLVTIRYMLGGVSTGTTINPLMVSDENRYNHTQRIEKLSELSRFYRNLLIFNVRFHESKKKIDQIKLIMQHPFVVLYKLFYRIENNFFMLYDRYCIKQEAKKVGNMNEIERRMD